MFELLLQAERALSKGALDQAEKSFWQLIEADTQNAIAIAGLARVSIERGDMTLARLFAAKALALDPDSFAARRVMETLDNNGVAPPVAELPDLPMLAAERLEELGRRHAAAREVPGAEAGRVAAPKQREAAELALATPLAGEPSARKKAGPEAAPELPPEPLRARRQAGREAAAAAVEAARASAARTASSRAAAGEGGKRAEQARPSHPPGDDRFAAAEMEATLEAVSSVDEPTPVPAPPRPKFEPIRSTPPVRPIAPYPPASISSIDDLGEDESVAMRLALVADAASPEEAGALAAQELRAVRERSEEDAEKEAAELARMFERESQLAQATTLTAEGGPAEGGPAEPEIEPEAEAEFDIPRRHAAAPEPAPGPEDREWMEAEAAAAAAAEAQEAKTRAPEPGSESEDLRETLMAVLERGGTAESDQPPKAPASPGAAQAAETPVQAERRRGFLRRLRGG
jgi:tetratricopeptide (TPR) repeat protein